MTASMDERVRSALSSVLRDTVLEGRAVWMPALGLFLPEERVIVESQLDEGALRVREVRQRFIRFEKCGELTSFHRERVAHLCDLSPLASTIERRTGVKVSSRDLIEFGGFLSSTVASFGRCDLIREIGVLLALHNRQGSHPSDWYAGADVFLVDAGTTNLTVLRDLTFAVPVHQSSWDIFSAAYGTPSNRDVVTLNVEGREIQIAPFVIDRSQRDIMLVTDGLRHFLPDAAREVVLAVRADETDELVPRWALRTLHLLLQNPRSLGGSTPVEIPDFVLPSKPWGRAPSGRQLPSTRALLAPFPRQPLIQFTGTGSFTYASLLIVHPDEGSFANDFGTEALLPFLSHRGLDLISTLRRPSILRNSSHQSLASSVSPVLDDQVS